MTSTIRRTQGFTLIELAVVLTVVAILLAIGLPSFIALRQRATLGAAGEQVLGVWNQTRLEAAKRNTLVKFSVNTDGANFCVGAAETTDSTDDTPCDCFDPAATTDACDVALFPKDQEQWNRVTLSGTPTLGEDTGVVIIEPKRTSLIDSADIGAITLAGPPGQYSYKLNFRVDRFGRGVLCESSSAAQKMPAFNDRICGP
jgi:prepilin-type N-terminal cleavage/methylation domain-containing protein